MNPSDYEKLENYNDKLESLSLHIQEALLCQNIYQPGVFLDISKPHWHMDDFVADVDINSHWMASMINGVSDSMQEDMQEKFEAYCTKIAAKCFNEVQRLKGEL